MSIFQVRPFGELFANHELLLAWVVRTLRGRYQQSVLGVLWSIIQPAASAVIFSIIFTLFVHVNTAGMPYLVFSYTAMVPWTLFSSSIVDMVDSVVGNMNLVSKIYFPREIFPVSAMLARLVDFAIAESILVLLIIFYQLPIFPLGWLCLPIILATQLALMLGVGLAGAALNVFYRDIRQLVVLGLQIWLYASPVIYPSSSVPESLRPFYYLNPMAGIIEGYRAVLLYQTLPGPSLYISMVSALVILATGYWIFKRVEYKFADVI